MLELIKPNTAELVGLIVALIILVAGIATILRAHRIRRRWTSRSSPEHRREMTARKQKAYEDLPPGQW